MPKVSVIIPVYNVEKYLRECLDSVVNQTLQDIEIICINDGSTDNSLEILKEYAKRDERIDIIDSINKGVSTARNLGIDKSQGKYIIFVDSDDWLEPDCIAKAFDNITKTKADILCYGFNIIDNLQKQKCWHFEIIKNNCLKPEYNIQALKPFLTYVWDKIYRAEFIKKNQIYFPENISTAEDGIFNLFCLYKKPKYIFLPQLFYNYRTNNKNSATNQLENVILSDSIAFKYIINSSQFGVIDENLKILTIEKFINGIYYYYTKNKNFARKLKYIYQINKLIKYIYKCNLKNLFLKASNCLFLLNLRYKNILFNNIYSITISSDKTHKILTILGIKIKFRRRVRNAEG